jgi:L-alanine-DL-glutamate epimerase-like enolase superfamily enzyme
MNDSFFKNVAAVREAIGYVVPLATDHFGHFSVNDAIRLGRALTPYQPTWLEDMVLWQYADLWKEITNTVDVPTLTGEEIYLKKEFIKLIDAHAVDLIHPDLATAGGILETKPDSAAASASGTRPRNVCGDSSPGEADPRRAIHRRLRRRVLAEGPHHGADPRSRQAG